jgi:hypothetical protein
MVPSIIVAAYQEQSLSLINRAFDGLRAAPLESYLDRWTEIAAAVPVTGILHLAIIFFIRSIWQKHQGLYLVSAKSDFYVDIFLILFSATFLLLSIPIWFSSIYVAYIGEWTVVLEGGKPWLTTGPINAYGPMFNVLALPILVTPLANKVLFAFAYLAFVIWLLKDFGARQGVAIRSWPVVVFWFLNPYVWVELVYFGHFDVLVGITCVAAVHSRVLGKDVVSAIGLAAGVLLKYMPIVILPFLMIDNLRVRLRLLFSCVAIVILGFSISVLIWGTSTFSPLTFAASRESRGSIYDMLNRAPSLLELVNRPFGTLWDTPNVDWLATPCLMVAGLGIFGWCTYRRTEPALSAVLAILVTLLFYRVGYVHYEIVLFLLVSYWAVSEWKRLSQEPLLTALIVGHFAVLALLDLAIFSEIVSYGYYGRLFVLLKFVTGCAMLAGLVRFSVRKAA